MIRLHDKIAVLWHRTFNFHLVVKLGIYQLHRVLSPYAWQSCRQRLPYRVRGVWQRCGCEGCASTGVTGRFLPLDILIFFLGINEAFLHRDRNTTTKCPTFNKSDKLSTNLQCLILPPSPHPRTWHRQRRFLSLLARPVDPLQPLSYPINSINTVAQLASSSVTTFKLHSTTVGMSKHRLGWQPCQILPLFRSKRE
jgi:hypothetical protein